MDADLSHLQQPNAYFKRSRILELAVAAGWLAGKWSAERANRSSWIAVDKEAAITAAFAFLELNQFEGDRRSSKSDSSSL